MSKTFWRDEFPAQLRAWESTLFEQNDLPPGRRKTDRGRRARGSRTDDRDIVMFSHPRERTSRLAREWTTFGSRTPAFIARFVISAGVKLRSIDNAPSS